MDSPRIGCLLMILIVASNETRRWERKPFVHCLFFRFVCESTFMTSVDSSLGKDKFPWMSYSMCGNCWDITWNYIASSIRIFILLYKKLTFSWGHSKSIFSSQPLAICSSLALVGQKKTMILTVTWWRNTITGVWIEGSRFMYLCKEGKTPGNMKPEDWRYISF